MQTRVVKHSPRLWTMLVVLLIGATASQVVLEGKFDPRSELTSVHWVQSPSVMRRLTMGFNAIWADLYWIRAVQYYGDNKLSTEARKNYDLLYPLLDITTTLDPYFNIAYRFGAILLSEGYPNGPGDPAKAIRLLEKGIGMMPDRWQYYQDAGFIEYWWRRDSKAAADWYTRASQVKGAPEWLPSVAASVLAAGGERAAARSTWTQLLETADHEWLRQVARRGLMQLDAEAQIELLQSRVGAFHTRNGRFPKTWDEMASGGYLRGRPVDPSGYLYALDPVTGAVDVARGSNLYPLRNKALR